MRVGPKRSSLGSPSETDPPSSSSAEAPVDPELERAVLAAMPTLP